jgi:hypothetical protein
MIASGWREQSQGHPTLGKEVQDGFFLTKKPLSFHSPGWSYADFAPTAPPQVGSEVDSVTNSACQCLLEASQGSPTASGINQIAPIVGAIRVQSGVGHDPRMHSPVYTTSRYCILSAPLGERRLAAS